jgi:acetoin utilization protein AcuC
MTAYGFHRGSAEGGRHFFGPDRFGYFAGEMARRGLWDRVREVTSAPASDDDLMLFHTELFLMTLRECCETNEGSLDDGPTPAEAHGPATAAAVAGASMTAVHRLLDGEARSVFVPIAGFHHAFAEEARNYCLFNDCALTLQTARKRGARVAYVDIDVHFGDGVFDAFTDDAGVCLIDLHQDGATFAGGPEREVGAVDDGRRFSALLSPGAEDDAFFARWEKALRRVRTFAPDLIVLQAGADGLAGDPLGGLALSELVHRSVTADLRDIAPRGLLVLGGGGYHPENLANAWCAVVETLIEDNVVIPKKKKRAVEI